MNKKEIQDVYPLAPLQEGLLFHAILDPESNAYFDQFIATFHGPLNLEHFKTAWQRIQENNPIFRTAFAWQSGSRSLQVVARQASLDITFLDWTSTSLENIDGAFETFLQADREKPFNLSKPPLMRITLIQLPEQEYRLVWSRHHLLLDGWSLSLILEEFVRYYTALHQQEPIQPIPRRPYRDYIQWVQKQDAQQAGTFWTRYLGDLEACTQVRIGANKTPTGSNNRYTELTGTLSTKTTNALESLARSSKVTLNTVVKAAWAIMLKRLTGDNSVIFGDTVSGRPENLDGVETQVGLFINTLPLHVDIDATVNLTSWLRSLQQNENELRQFEFSALSQIQSLSNIPRELPLFESIVVFENYPVSQVLSAGIPDIKIESTHTFERTHYPITLIVAPGEQLEWILILDDDLYPGEIGQRIHTYFATLLEQLPDYAQSSVGNIPILPDAESQKLLRNWNQDTLEHNSDLCLHQLFEQQAIAQPDAIAVTDGKTSLSYNELDQRATVLARHLITTGVTQESRIGVCLNRHPNLIVSLLAVLKAGATYIPLDPAYPSDRIAYMLKDAQAEILLTETAVELELEATKTVYVDSFDFTSNNPTPTLVAPLPNQLAYIIYTSGSTGRPKGTAIEHRNAVSLAAWAYREYTDTEWAGVLTSTSVCFDLSIFEIFVTLGAGGKLILADNALELSSHPNKDEVTLINTVPSAISELLRLESIPDSVKTINLAGEPLTAALADKLYAETNVDKVYDLYGPSEDTTYSTWILRQPGMPATIGRPIANTKLYLLDSDFQTVPTGAVGEIYLEGEGVVRGYWNRPDLTAERFIPNPFSTATSNNRLYKTGDLARYTESGNLEFLGRADHQIKIRGFRIELGEIQTVLERLDSIKEAAVIALDGDNDKQIVAYIVQAANQTPIEVESLRRALAEKLPEYMVPANFVLLDELPRTPNGKLNRKALPQPGNENTTPQAAIIAPRNALEAQLLDIWKEVLSLETISVTDSFFALGGHSLLATRVLSRVRKGIDKSIPLRLIFESSTIEAQAIAIEAKLNSCETSTALDIPKASREQPLPLSYSQERIWFLQQYDTKNPAYNIPIVVKLEGALDVDLLQQSLQSVIQRHEALRTHCELTAEGPRQVIKNQINFAIETVDLSNQSIDAQQACIEQHKTEEATTPFAIQSKDTPLIRAKQLRLSDTESLLLLTFHHIIADGWSFNTILNDFAQSYTALTQNREPAFQALPIEYADYAQWHRQSLEDGAFQPQIDFWKKQLAAVSPINLPTDYPRPAQLSFNGRSVTRTFAPEQQQALLQFAQSQNTTLFNVLLTAWQMLLARYTGQTDFAIGTPVAGRNHPDLENIVGVFINTLTLPCQFDLDDTVTEAIQKTAQFSLDAFANQDIPFERIIESLGLARDLSRPPLFQILFVLQNTPLQPASLPGLTLTPISAESSTAKFDLTLSVEETPQGLRASLEYNLALFKASTIERLLENFNRLLDELTAHQNVRTLPLLTDVEIASILKHASGPSKTWNANATTTHGLFEARAERTPDLNAVADDHQSMSYAQLNRSANQLAHHLQSRNIRHGKTVALVLEPSVDVAITLLAILKTGAAYVPLDPNYPASRLIYMLEDSRAAALITRAPLLDTLPAEVKQQLQSKDIELTLLDRERSIILQQPTENPKNTLSARDLVYLIYTSGSTGQPKGSAIYHEGFTNLLQWYQHEASINSSARILMISSLSFDLTQKNLFTPLLAGGALYFANTTTFDPWRILDAIEQHHITHINCAPSAFYPLVDLAQETDFKALQSLTCVYLGGEPIAHERLCPWLNSSNCQAQIVNSYGPTECTDVCSFDRIPQTPSETPIPLGHPVSNTQVFVMDDAHQLAPIGVIGEICVGGIGVGMGYWNQPELTAEKFIPHPYSAHAGARLYKTGDLGKMWEDGRIEFIGRKDFQIKIRGLRVELGEVEAALRTLPHIQDAVAVVQQTETQHPQLVAYLKTTQSEIEVSHDTIRDQLQDKLPEYMVPAHFMLLEKFPTTPSGKIDRKRLPSIELKTATDSKSYRAPQSEEEKVLATLWQEVLNLPKIGIDDNFFSLGGDSILSIQIVSRANQAGYRLDPSDLFQNQTIARLALVCRQSKIETAEQGIVTGECPFSPIQHWFFQQDFAHPHHWNQSMLLQMNAPLDTALLEDAVQKLLQQHDALRLRFQLDTERNNWKACYAEFSEASDAFFQSDLSDTSDDNISETIEKTCDAIQGSLNIEQGPLCKIGYLNTGPNRSHRLLFVVHHLIIDGVSWHILLEDLLAIYNALVESTDLKLPKKTHAYRQWVNGLVNVAQDSKFLSDLNYWTAQAQHSTTPILRDFPQNENKVADTQLTTTQLNAEQTRLLLEAVPTNYKIRIHEVLLTALARTLKNWTRHHAPCIQLESHGRDSLQSEIDITRTLGWFTAIHPVRLDLGHHPDLVQQLLHLKESLRKIPNHGITYGVLRYLHVDANVREQLAAMPHPEIAFNYLGQVDRSQSPGKLDIVPASENTGSHYHPEERRPYLIEINGGIANKTLKLEWSYSSQVHRPETIQQLAQQFQEELKLLIQHCTQTQKPTIHTPSDFSASKLKSKDLKKILSKIKK